MRTSENSIIQAARPSNVLVLQSDLSLWWFMSELTEGRLSLTPSSWLSMEKQMCGQMQGADGQARLEPWQPVAPSQPHNQRTGWSDSENMKRPDFW